ncbi:hypothetical protein HZH68_011715 [Vespula germanica]|uniref:Uncharacterized protein n=1 Tax=Vespula germanica TaxID=30212 RepID=A0A834JJX0_VESGE|nr:hypothetical protein HZH68_011715 [Vespula germanica]
MLRVRNSLGSAHLCTDRSLCRQCGRRCGECNCGTPNDTASCTYDCRFRRGTSVSPRDIPGTCEKKKENDVVIPKSLAVQQRRMRTDSSADTQDDDAFFDSEDDDEDQDESNSKVLSTKTIRLLREI